MQNSQLNRVLKLVRRTGDKLVIFDKETDAAYAVMDLDQYENLLDEADFDPSDWDDDDDTFASPRSDSGFAPVGSVIKDRWNENENNFDLPAEEKIASPENWHEEELESDEFVESKNKNLKTEKSKKEFTGEEVSLHDVPHDEEEETFLLEPVE